MTKSSSNNPVIAYNAELRPADVKTSIFLFLAVNFLWWIGLYLYVPVFPVYIKSTGANLTMVGIVLAAYAIPQVVFRIPLGILSDKLGKRKVLVAAGIIFSSLGALGLGLVHTPWLLFLFRLITGAGTAAWVVFPLYFSAYFPAKDSGKAMGLINSVQNFALIAATAGSGFIAESAGDKWLFFIAAALGIVTLSGLFLTRESPIARVHRTDNSNIFKIATKPLLLVISLMGIMMNFAMFTGVFGFIPLYAAEFGATKGQLGLITMVNMGFSALGSLATNRMQRKIGNRFTILGSALLISAAFFIIPFTHSAGALMAVQAVSGFGAGIIMTLSLVLSIDNVPRERQATTMGVFQAIYAIGMLAGPIISGFLSSRFNLSSVFYLSSGIVLLVALLAFLPIFSKKTKNFESVQDPEK
jgi:MFS family permease